MKFTTWYGYFGRSHNVRDAAIDAATTDSLMAILGALPRRRPPADIVPLPIARGPNGERLRFIPIAHGQPGGADS